MAQYGQDYGVVPASICGTGAYKLKEWAKDDRMELVRHEGYTWGRLSSNHIGFNMEKDVFKDVRVRKAVAHAVNRQEIVQFVMKGQADVSHGFLHPLAPGASSKEQMRPFMADFSLDKSKKLLSEAGWMPGADGISSAIPSPNTVRWRDDPTDTLFQQSQTTLKEPERVKAFQGIEQRLVGEAVVVPIQHIRWIFGSRPRAHGLKYHPIHGIYKLMDVWVG